MKKFLLISSLMLIFVTTTQIAKADSIMLPDGSVIKGKIKTVLSGLVEINTERGIKRISREVAVGQARDIVEYGLILKKRVMGEVFFVSSTSVEVATSSGNLSLNRFWVRDLILSQQLPLDAAPGR
jgi:hypothetical protein